MPRNPMAVAKDRAMKADASYRKGDEMQHLLLLRRNQALRNCYDAGMSITEIGRLFTLSRPYVYKVLAEEQVA